MSWFKDVNALRKNYANIRKLDKIMIKDVVFDLENIIEKNRKVRA